MGALVYRGGETESCGVSVLEEWYVAWSASPDPRERSRMISWLCVTSIRRAGLGVGVLWMLLMVGGIAHAQPDSVRTAVLKAKGFPPDHSPRGALWRSAVPGWGQAYNRQYYKLPFVYAGLAGGGFAIFRMNRRYLLFRRAHLFTVGENRDGDNNPYGNFKDEYDEAASELGAGQVSGRQLRSLRDKYRRWRDLSILGTGLFYALTILDAYVSAHLLTFDVDDVALDVRPTGGGRIQARSGATEGRSQASHASVSPNGVGVRVRVRF